jgi:hypothetical protein
MLLKEAEAKARVVAGALEGQEGELREAQGLIGGAGSQQHAAGAAVKKPDVDNLKRLDEIEKNAVQLEKTLGKKAGKGGGGVEGVGRQLMEAEEALQQASALREQLNEAGVPVELFKRVQDLKKQTMQTLEELREKVGAAEDGHGEGSPNKEKEAREKVQRLVEEEVERVVSQEAPLGGASARVGPDESVAFAYVEARNLASALAGAKVIRVDVGGLGIPDLMLSTKSRPEDAFKLNGMQGSVTVLLTRPGVVQSVALTHADSTLTVGCSPPRAFEIYGMRRFNEPEGGQVKLGR